MKIAVFGTGGVGGYFGGLLAQAGHDVSFIARGDHLAAMQTHGLSVRSPHGDFNLDPVRATDAPEEIGVVDYLIIAVKDYHLQEAIMDMPALVGAQTVILPLLNGVDAHLTLRQSLGEGTVVGGFCSIASRIESPGVIHQESKLRRVVAGELDGRVDKRLTHLIEAWSACGAEAIHSSQILIDIWTKFLFIASFGCVSSLTRTSLGEILHSPQTRSILVEAMREVEALARALDISLEPDVVDQSMKLLESFEPGTTSSMQRDVESGRPFELDAFSGKILELADSRGISTPVFAVLDALLRPGLNRSMMAG